MCVGDTYLYVILHDLTNLSSRGSGGSGQPEREAREIQTRPYDAVVVVRIHAYQILILIYGEKQNTAIH